MNNFCAKLGYIIFGYGIVNATSWLVLLSIGVPNKFLHIIPQSWMLYVMMLIIGPIVEEIGKRLAIKRGLIEFPLAFGVTEFITYTPVMLLGILSPMTWLIIRIPVVFMHWGTGLFQQQFQSKTGTVGAIIIHSSYNGLAILLFSAYLGWV